MPTQLRFALSSTTAQFGAVFSGDTVSGGSSLLDTGRLVAAQATGAVKESYIADALSAAYVLSIGGTLTAARTVTFPDASITVAGINLAQTWTATQAFAAISATSVTDSGLTSGRITRAGASGILTDSDALTYSSSLLTVNLNATATASLPAVITGAALRLVGTDALTSYGLSLETFGGQSNYWARRANGTAASPSALNSGEVIGGFFARGYGTTGYSAASRVLVIAKTTEAWTDSAQGTSLELHTTAVGGTTTVARLTLTGAAANFASTVAVTISSATASTTTGTGALIVAGGLGVAGAINSGAHTASSITDSALTSGRVTYAGASGLLSDDSAFTRGTLTLGIDPTTDNTFSTGYGKLGLATSGTSTAFYLAQASNYTSSDYALQQTSGGTTHINGKLGASVNTRINNVTKMTVAGSSASLVNGVPFTVNDVTASTTTGTGALIVAGGAGIAGAVNAGSMTLGAALPIASGGTASTTAATARVALGCAVDQYCTMIEAPTAKTYTIIYSSKVAFTINELTAVTTSGTCTVAVKINGTNVTGLSAVAVTSTPSTTSGTAANTVATTDIVTCVVSSPSSCVDLVLNIKVTI